MFYMQVFDHLAESIHKFLTEENMLHERLPLGKNLGRLWLAYTELQGDFTWKNSYLLTLGTLHSQNSAYSGPIYTK